MKNIPLFFIILISIALSVNTTSSCMENDTRIGTIDMLMLARSVLQQGHSIVERDINNHQFTKAQWTNTKPSQYIIVDNPYRIIHYCSDNDNSALSDQVFDKISKTTKQIISLEIKNQRNKYLNAIDEHTLWTPIKNSNEIKVIANFYDKQALLTALKIVNTYTQYKTD